MTAPELSVVVVHWHDEAALAELLAAGIEADDGVEWIVVDNSQSGSSASRSDQVVWVTPSTNLGFGGGANLGVSTARGSAILILNPDARPAPGALDALRRGLREHPEAAGLVPRLHGPTHEPQWRWQLKALPTPWQLLAHALFVDPVRGPQEEPAAGTPIAQPAAAALLLRRPTLEAVAGFDPRFQPAWFEDVDLARRLADRGGQLLYYPAAEFTHGQGGSVAPLGFDRFLWAYYRNLTRYLQRHGGGWRRLLPPLLALGMGLRLALLPVRKPARATSRRVAARGLTRVLLGALSGWRWAP